MGCVTGMRPKHEAGANQLDGGTRQGSSHSDCCPRLVQASGTDPLDTRAHNPVGAAQRNNQPP